MAKRFLGFGVAVGAVILTSIAAYGAKIPPQISEHGVDKILHATMGAILTYLLARAIAPRHAGIAALVVFVPLAADEYLQRFSASRSSDWGDLFADALGIVLAAWAVHRTTRRRLRFAAPT